MAKKAYPLKFKRQGGLKMQHVIDEFYTDEGRAAFRRMVSIRCGRYSFKKSRYDWLSAGGAGTMGFGFPASIGAAFGRRDDIISVLWAMGVQMTFFELATAAIHKLPVKIVV